MRATGLDFRRGGFELPVDRPPTLIRAFNVLRQYDEPEVAGVWRSLIARLAPDGLLIEGTCSESGRIATWVALERGGPISLTFAARLGSLESPAVFAQRLPKALIHRNVPGEPIYDFVRALDRAWQTAASLGSLGVRQRWIGAVESLRPGVADPGQGQPMAARRSDRRVVGDRAARLIPLPGRGAEHRPRKWL